MNRGNVGIGSASIMLVFTVLCLTVFSLISYTVAENEKILIETEARLVTNYYEADMLAERILAEIMASEQVPQSVFGIEINTCLQSFPDAILISFSSAVNETTNLSVEAVISGDLLSIITWRMINEEYWIADESLNVWQRD